MGQTAHEKTCARKEDFGSRNNLTSLFASLLAKMTHLSQRILLVRCFELKQVKLVGPKIDRCICTYVSKYLQRKSYILSLSLSPFFIFLIFLLKVTSDCNKILLI